MADPARAPAPPIPGPTTPRPGGARRARMPDLDRAAADFMASDLPWLEPEATAAFAEAPEILGRSTEPGPPPVRGAGDRA